MEEEIDKLLERSEEVDASEDNDGSGIPEEIKDREYRMKRLEEARKRLEEEKNTEGYIPDNKLESLDRKEESEKLYDKSNFVYNEHTGQYSCPEGKILAPIPRGGRIEENRRFTMRPIVVGVRLKLGVSKLKPGR